MFTLSLGTWGSRFVCRLILLSSPILMYFRFRQVKSKLIGDVLMIRQNVSIIYFCQMRHELYERPGELLAMKGGGRPVGPPVAPCLLFCWDYHYSRIKYFCQMRHELYERLGELLATRGGSALLDLQLFPATVLQGLPLFKYYIFLSDETRAV
jgi:hypothetical protein